VPVLTIPSDDPDDSRKQVAPVTRDRVSSPWAIRFSTRHEGPSIGIVGHRRRKTWIDAGPTLQARTTVVGLTAGATVLFRYRWVLKGGAGDWSPSVSMLVH